MKFTKPTLANMGKAAIEARELLSRSTVAAVETAAKTGKLLVESAEDAQKTIKETSRKVKDTLDDLTETLPIKDLKDIPSNQPLYAVLDQMDRAELTGLYAGPLGMNHRKDKDTSDNASDDGMRHHVAAELLSSAKNSLKLWRELPSYDEVVRLVAQRVNVSDATQAEIADVERAILFKIVDLSISKMTDEEKQMLTKQVEAELAARGVHRKVTLGAITDFTGLMALDLVPEAISLVGSAGLTGTVLGVNALQLIVLKSIVATSGYVAAGGAFLGLGVGGTMMAIAGAAGPIALVLGTLYASYTLAGPAFRKLIPGICVIAAKRIEVGASPQS
jgi:uncharacterized protein YaaW (UPF0174 family)